MRVEWDTTGLDESTITGYLSALTILSDGSVLGSYTVPEEDQVHLGGGQYRSDLPLSVILPGHTLSPGDTYRVLSSIRVQYGSVTSGLTQGPTNLECTIEAGVTNTHTPLSHRHGRAASGPDQCAGCVRGIC